MVVEYIRYRVAPDRSDEFESAYSKAAASLGASPHCLAYEIARGIEDPNTYVVRSSGTRSRATSRASARAPTSVSSSAP